jgi:hypothetical protein
MKTNLKIIAQTHDYLGLFIDLSDEAYLYTINKKNEPIEFIANGDLNVLAEIFKEYIVSQKINTAHLE